MGEYTKGPTGGAKIIKALEDAAAGNFARVTINGQVWVREDRALIAELMEAIEALLNAETNSLHVGYDSGPGGGNYVYTDAIRTDDEAFSKLKAALFRAKGEPVGKGVSACALRPLFSAPQPPGWNEAMLGQTFAIEHDGFVGMVIGGYITKEGKRGVVLQQQGTRVVHVYGEKWLKRPERDDAEGA